MHIFNKTRLEGFSYSGFNLVDEVNQLKPNKIVDVGCGENLFKGLIQNLYGFDPIFHSNLDQQASIDTIDFDANSIDVALCLGSIQYGDANVQFNQLTKVVSWVKPGGYIVMRKWPFLDYVGHHEEYLKKINRICYSDFYIWTEKLNLTVYKEIKLDINRNFPELERLVWWWQKAA
jgi:hypothetical protein